jgi:hypothetical protein
MSTYRNRPIHRESRKIPDNFLKKLVLLPFNDNKDAKYVVFYDPFRKHFAAASPAGKGPRREFPKHNALTNAA